MESGGECLRGGGVWAASRWLVRLAAIPLNSPLNTARPTSLAEGSHENAWVIVPAGAAASIVS